MFEKDLEVPKKGPTDYVHSTVTAAIAAIPQWWAAPAAEIFSLVIASPIEQRRDEFLEDMAWVVRETARRVDDLQPEKLAQNQAFISATLQAARIAMNTHQREKREYLRNALLNIALGRESEEVKHQIFLNAIDAFTPVHVKVLNLIWRGPSLNIPWDEKGIPHHNRNYAQAIEISSPEVKGQPYLIAAILGELRNRGFSNLNNADVSFPQGGINTNLGIEFLNFILSPEDLPK